MEKSRMLNILVVDNEREICRMFEKWFSLEAHRVETVLTGKKAISLVKKKYFDIVFLNVILVELQGIEVLEKIKEISPKIKVIMISGKLLNKYLLSDLREKGASGFLQKPFSIEDLHKLLDSI